MDEPEQEIKRHMVAGGAPGRGRSVENPLAKGLNVTVSVPETIEIKMVNVSTLDDYEMWLFMAAVFINFAVGFGVAYFQDQTKLHFLFIALGAFILFVGTFVFSLHKRKQLRTKSKSIKLRTAEVIEDIEVEE